MIHTSCETFAIVVAVVVLAYNFSWQPSWLLCVIHSQDYLMRDFMSDVCQRLVARLDSKDLVGKKRVLQQKRLKLAECIVCPVHVVQICNCHVHS